MRTKAGLRERPGAPMAGLTELLLCVMFAAAELIESLRQPGNRSPEERPA